MKNLSVLAGKIHTEEKRKIFLRSHRHDLSTIDRIDTDKYPEGEGNVPMILERSYMRRP
jgi:hypothetical protein